MSKVRAKRAPFTAEPAPRVRVLQAAATQMRSRTKGLPAAIVERQSADVDPARRVRPDSLSYQADPSSGGAGGGTGGGGASTGGAGSGGEGEAR